MSFKIAVNQTIVAENEMINENDEIALLPPFAGGWIPLERGWFCFYPFFNG